MTIVPTGAMRAEVMTVWTTMMMGTDILTWMSWVMRVDCTQDETVLSVREIVTAATALSPLTAEQQTAVQ